jgi:hypothetical protein
VKNRTINNLKNIRLFLLLFLLAVGANAQSPPPFPDDVDDVAPVVPINDWIIPVAILGFLLGCYIIRRRIKENNINKLN